MTLQFKNEITQQEFCDHIEDDDFFLRFGNPVIIKTDTGTKLLCVAVEYYEQLTGEKLEVPEGYIKND